MSLLSRPNTPPNIPMFRYLEGCRAARHQNLTDQWLMMYQDPTMRDIWPDLCAIAQPKWDRSFEELSGFIHRRQMTSNDHIKYRMRQLNAWRSQEPRTSFPPQRILGPWISPEQDPDWADFCAGPMEGDPKDMYPDMQRQLAGRIAVLKWQKQLEKDPPAEYVVAPKVVKRVLKRARGESSHRLG
ncbi:hypothetical protein BU16DRAFT_541369 [Lophium mytilinum]|uniref:Uncharacterized protein n=1 Tax=Lophium mytilinum TaxID=390894 RepID=A0A6A6QKB4_9PEZI|nr:hypothetical protein BU16DRAFT_541369 [Lophium mytilinum]